jgi:hypothetical protein
LECHAGTLPPGEILAGCDRPLTAPRTRCWTPTCGRGEMSL